MWKLFRDKIAEQLGDFFFVEIIVSLQQVYGIIIIPW